MFLDSSASFTKIENRQGILILYGSVQRFFTFQISVGFVGYPNVGKSSVVNTLRKKKVCKAAPLAGETKYWQYVTLMKKIFLIDCPGVVYPQGDTETQIILKGVVSFASTISHSRPFRFASRTLPTLKTTSKPFWIVFDPSISDVITEWTSQELKPRGLMPRTF